MKTLEAGSRQNAFALAGLRIAVGSLFLIFGEYKVFGTQFTLHGGFQGWINKFIQDGAAYSFMVPVLTGFVLPHATPIAYLVAYGVWVRIASLFGFIYMLTLLFSSNFPGQGAPLWEYFGSSLDHSVLALCFAAFMVARSDDALSIKEYIFKVKRS